MGSLYEHIEHLGKAGGYKNMTVLCKAAGVPRTTMSELNAGRSKDLSKPNAQKFADLLGISLDDIYGTEKQKPATISDDGLTDKERELISILKQLPEEALDSIENLAKVLLNNQ